MVQKFKCYRQPHKYPPATWRCQNPHCLCFLSPKANHYAAYITVLSVCLRQLPDCHDICCHTFEGHRNTVRFISLPLVTTIWRTREFLKQQQHEPHILDGNQLMFMGFRILCIVYGNVCLRYRVREKVLFNCRKKNLCQSERLSERIYC